MIMASKRGKILLLLLLSSPLLPLSANFVVAVVVSVSVAIIIIVFILVEATATTSTSSFDGVANLTKDSYRF